MQMISALLSPRPPRPAASPPVTPLTECRNQVIWTSLLVRAPSQGRKKVDLYCLYCTAVLVTYRNTDTFHWLTIDANAFHIFLSPRPRTQLLETVQKSMIKGNTGITEVALRKINERDPDLKSSTAYCKSILQYYALTTLQVVLCWLVFGTNPPPKKTTRRQALTTMEYK